MPHHVTRIRVEYADGFVQTAEVMLNEEFACEMCDKNGNIYAVGDMKAVDLAFDLAKEIIAPISDEHDDPLEHHWGRNI